MQNLVMKYLNIYATIINIKYYSLECFCIGNLIATDSLHIKSKSVAVHGNFENSHFSTHQTLC